MLLRRELPSMTDDRQLRQLQEITKALAIAICLLGAIAVMLLLLLIKL